ncbi:MAG TPA: LCP family protein, partial [Actinomycetes bacterium]|nr:LCP family protein [Actinomycetes bacterium]
MREPGVLPDGSGASRDWWASDEPAVRRPPRVRQPPPGWPPPDAQARPKRPLVAALLSCLVPGAGQLYLGYRRRGTVMLVVTVLCLAMAIGLWSEPAAVSRMLVQPRALLALLVADIGLLVFRVVAVLDAYLLATRDRGRATPAAGGWRRGAAVGLVAIVTLTAAPHAAAAYYDLQAYDLLTSVFAGEDPHWQARERDRHDSGNGLVTAIPGRVTVLLLGGDAGPGRRGLRTDTMIVASLEVATGKLALFGLPRNLVRVPLPDGPAADFFGECRCFPRLLNELYAFAEDERPDLFPHSRRPGIAAVAGAAEQLLGLPIDHYALVDLLGFVDLVDAVGGVTVNNLKPLDIEIDRLGRPGPRPAFEIQPGRRHLNGFTALAYSRSRETTSDYDRMQRQRCVIGSLARQTDPTELLAAFPKLVKVLKHTVATDIPASRLPTLLEAAGDKPVKVATIGFQPPTYNSGWSSGYPIPDVAKIQSAVRRMTRPAADTTTTTRADPDGIGGVTSTTRAPATR